MLGQVSNFSNTVKVLKAVCVASRKQYFRQIGIHYPDSLSNPGQLHELGKNEEVV